MSSPAVKARKRRRIVAIATALLVGVLGPVALAGADAGLQKPQKPNKKGYIEFDPFTLQIGVEPGAPTGPFVPFPEPYLPDVPPQASPFQP